MKRLGIDERYITISLSRAIIASVILVAYCLYLALDNFLHGTPSVGRIALICGGLTAVSALIFHYCRKTNRSGGFLMYIGILIECFVYLGAFAYFLYTGGAGGTSIFLLFNAAPATVFFYNLFYGTGFSLIVFFGMLFYMNSPLRFLGYQFPEMYYSRLPMMYLVEVVMCAVAQYVAVKARINQDIAVEEANRASRSKSEFLAKTSHEIRTPINAMLNMNEMILRETAGAESARHPGEEDVRQTLQAIKRYAVHAESAGNNLLEIINEILDIAKIEEGIRSLTPEDVKIDDKAAVERRLEDRGVYHELFRAPDANILVVDDTEMNLTVLEELLRQTQVRTDMVLSGREAVEKAKETAYDLILMDYRMPEMDGAMTMNAIRAQEDGLNQKTPVICLTADAVKGARERFLSEGFTDYLSKPVDAVTLEKTLMRYIPEEKVSREIAQAPAGQDEKREKDARDASPQPDTQAAESALHRLYDSTGLMEMEDAMQYSFSEEMLQKTLAVFYKTLPGTIEEIERYFAQGDYENYTIKVHAMKSSARLIGATEISAQAEKLEQMGNLLLGR